MIETILTFASIVSLATLAGITFLLGRPRNVTLFITVGQDVFRWCTAVLVAVLLTRGGTTLFHLSSSTAKFANSLSFVLAVVGITYSVVRHGKRN